MPLIYSCIFGGTSFCYITKDFLHRLVVCSSTSDQSTFVKPNVKLIEDRHQNDFIDKKKIRTCEFLSWTWVIRSANAGYHYISIHLLSSVNLPVYYWRNIHQLFFNLNFCVVLYWLNLLMQISILNFRMF